ncbi:MAG: ATP-dependent DNA helicase RecG [Patescibacteria group bacterium]|jgi:ATP-dependent DNA helicase RecG
MLSLNSPISDISGIGKALAKRFANINLETVLDLIFCYPFRYEDYSRIIKISDLKEGETATIVASIDLISNRRSVRKRKIMTEAIVSDDSGSVKIIWFNQPWIGKSLRQGDKLYISGKVTGDMFNVYFNSPMYEKYSSNFIPMGIVPIYSSTEGLSQKQIRSVIKLAIHLVEQIEDFLPHEIQTRENLISLSSALRIIHFPNDMKELEKARTRLSFDELFLVQLWSQVIKQENASQKSYPMDFFEAKIKEFVSNLKFELTLDQKRSAWEIMKDMMRLYPMNRLLNGDVGSGKTVVAALGIYQSYLNGLQSVIMVPTEILAFQHYRNLQNLFLGTDIKIGLLTRTQKLFNGEKISKNKFIEKCQAGEIDLIVGTHALIQDGVEFSKLGLAIVDEQHRFGVEQRHKLIKRGESSPHFLSLTATPIPRSLSLIVYGDLDLSLIKQMPKGRKKIITKLVPPEKRNDAYKFIDEQIKKGRQVFVICPLIDPSDKLGVRSVTEEFEKLDKLVFPHLSVGLLHGRLKSEEKEAVMKKFSDGDLKLLVSTSVVEVGVDIPNASIMMIEGAERFGLAQLHQFRGRVGRGDFQSFCFLFSDSEDMKSFQRLRYLEECSDGFELANRDLELRGSGSVYGYQQSGFAEFQIADINNLEQIKKAKNIAEELVGKGLENYPALTRKLENYKFTYHLE